MAWSEKLPSGKYRGMYRDAFGKQRSAGTFTHKAAAVRKAAVKEEAARKSMQRNPDAHKQLWGEWCDTWWKSRTVEPGTLSRDMSRRDVHLIPKWEHVPLGQITRHDIKTWAAELQHPDDDGKQLASSTVQRIVHLMSASLNAAVDAEIITANPAARIKLPPPPPAKDRYFDDDEYRLLVEQMPTEYDKMILEFLTNTGVRIGEFSGLHEHRLDLKRRVMMIAETYDEEMNEMKAYPKGKRARQVPIPEWLCILLAKNMRHNSGGTCGIKHRRGKCRSGLVFTTTSGTVLRRSNWDNVFWNALNAVNLGTDEEPIAMEHATLHDCRHTYASWLIQDGVSLSEVGRLLGHVSPATTQRYAHLADLDATQILAALPQRSVAPRLPHDSPIPITSAPSLARSSMVGPVGLEPTTHGLKVQFTPDDSRGHDET